MRNDLQDIEAIEAYVEGRLSDAERSGLELRLAQDADLAQQLSHYRSTREAIVRSNEDAAVRDLLRKTEEGADGHSTTWVRWAAAAAVIICIGGAAWMLARSSTSLPALAEEYAVQEPALPVFMSAPDLHGNELDRSMQLFGTGRYDEALAELGKLPTTDTVAFYAGLCTMRLGQDPSHLFRGVGDDTASTYRSKALYHLMLWHMVQDRPTEANALLQEQLGLNAPPYHDRLAALAASHALDR